MSENNYPQVTCSSGVYAIDIETVERPMEESLLADFESQIREELVLESAIQRRIEGFKERWKFTIGGAEIVGVGIFSIAAQETVPFFASSVSCSEKDLIDTVARQLIAMNPARLVAYNGNAFDFPILACAIAKYFNGFLPHMELYDLMVKPMGRHLPRMSLNSLAKLLGVFGKIGDGGQVKEYYESDKFHGTNLLEKYCLDDCRIVAECYLKLAKFYPMNSWN